MRYVAITGSRFYNNGIGVVPNALDSEKFPPAEDNIMRGNEIVWSNFNFHEGAPFKPKESGVVPLVPVGTGLLLFGGRRNTAEDNEVFGNYAVGVAAIEGFLLDDNPQARALVGNVVRGNEFGRAAGGRGRAAAQDGQALRQVLLPLELTVNKGSTITWKWPDDVASTCTTSGCGRARAASRTLSPSRRRPATATGAR